MPELPEVRVVAKFLNSVAKGKTITDILIRYEKMLTLEEREKLIGQRINEIKTQGKYLIFDLTDYDLISHLRMEGKYFLKSTDENIVKHEHIIFNLDNNIDLRYHDTRKFGKMILTTKDNLYNLPAIKKQGIEPLDSKLTVNYLKEKLRNKNLNIKTILLDQTIISGLGNIYANEVLYEAKINPLKKGKELTNQELKDLIIATNKIIKRAIELGGTTIKSYTSSLGVTGRFQQELKVHTKDKEKCLACNNKIEKIKLNGRSTYYCSYCQK